MKFRTRLAIRCAKFTSMAIKKMNRGSGVTLPGYIARLIDPNILSELSHMVRKECIVTMGTNGKTTTNALLYQAFKREGKKVIINRTGANMLNGIISAFVLATNKDGSLDADYACIEVDEFASLRVLPKMQPDAILLTNISRDQLDRFGEVDIAYTSIRKAISTVPNATLFINCDDILSYTLAKETKNPFVTYGISEQIFDEKSRSEIRESIFCRTCNHKLEYDFFHYGQLGMYHCPHCGLTRPTPDYTVTEVAEQGGTYEFDLDGMHVHSTIRSTYNIYNTLAAYTVLHELGLPKETYRALIESFDYGNNRENIFQIRDGSVQLHLAKNPIGFQQKVAHILRDTTPKDIIVQINDTYQDGEDVSWLWDVDFQHFRDANAASITTAGTRRYDMALRFKYDEIACDTTTDLRSVIQERLQHGTKNLYVIVNYSGLYQTHHLLKKLAEKTKGGANA
jgi:UDP-N-acetylmuramyl tripeptide synthase